jgi:hypothetical protein
MNRVECVQLTKACCDVVIQSEAKPKRRRNSDDECIQSSSDAETLLSKNYPNLLRYGRYSKTISEPRNYIKSLETESYTVH